MARWREMISTGNFCPRLLFFLVYVLIVPQKVTAQVNVALNKPTSQTSDLDFNGFLWTSDKAVDGCPLRDDSENQACCSCTQEQFGDNFWTVDLEQQYLIEAIIVLGRSDTPTQLQNFELFRRETEFDIERSVYNDNGVEYGDGNFTIILDPPVLAEFIVIRRPGILTLCEVQVFAVPEEETTTTTQQTTTTTKAVTTTTESGCPPFTFGESCTPCGNCLDNEVCNPTNGSCPSGCGPGYFGPTCTLGVMNSPCGNCLDNEVCNPVDGSCPSGCAAGYCGPTCSLECPGGLYGPSCLNLCGNCFLDADCNRETGICPFGCDEGYTTELCNETCPEFTYGLNCQNVCGYCINGETCNPVDGVCLSGCDPGWEGALCDTSMTTSTELSPTTTTTTTTTEETVQETNVALGQPATQFSTLDFGFQWTADKAVDNCLLRENPDVDACCSATEGEADNFWTVDLQQQYLVSRIVITGRLSEFSFQLEEFVVYTQEDALSPEVQVYDNTGADYGDGIFTITLPTPSLVQIVTIKRPTGNIIVLCEVQVFGATSTLPQTTTTTTATTTTAAATTTTISTASLPTTQSTTSVATTTTEVTETPTDPPFTVDTNIAVNKPATQFSTLEYLFSWTADKAVDNCTDRDDPDNQQCCSATEGGIDNFWTVDLQQQYLVYRIVVIGRTPESSNQLEGFEVYTRQESFFPELQVYDNTGQPYDDGIFVIDIQTPSLVQFVTVKRPSGIILVLCEVQVYAIPDATTTFSTTTSTTPFQSSTTATEAPITSTTTDPCPPNTYGEECTPCGNCLNDFACDAGTGNCPFGCDPGWQPPLCSFCVTGFYGNDCSQTCGNCEFGVPCDALTGACPGGCDSGWEGINCNLEITTTSLSPTTVNGGQTTVTQSEEVNVALGKPATQFFTLEYLFSWTADKAVDNCTDRDDPDNQQCCSATEGGIDNFWTVDLQQQYLISRIVVIGRTPDFSGQLEEFIVYTQQDGFSPEISVYNNAGQDYGDGIFTINLESPSLVRLVTLKRPMGSIMVICEVQVFAVIEDTTTTITTPVPTTSTVIPTSTTTSISTVIPTSTTAVTSTSVASTTEKQTEASTTTTAMVTTTTATEITDQTNIALGKPATQFSTLEYLFSWTADKAVDNCTDRDDPDNQQCCSATEGGLDNFWTVDLQQQYLVYRIVVIGRTPESSNQLEGFEVYTRQETFFPELQVYDNTGQPYDDGIFVIDIQTPSLVQFVTVKRPSGIILVLCEVQVYAIPDDTTTFSTTTSTTAFEPSTTTTVTSTLPTTTTTTTTAAATTTTTTLPITQSTTSATTTTTSEVTSTDFPFTVDTNIAFNKPATQFSTLEYLFSWTADKAVDNCTDRNDPDNQQCCSATEGGIDNFWTVDLQQQYLVYRIVVIGRTPESSNQLEGFEVYTRQESFFPELQVYDNTGQPYDDGIFVIDIQTPSLVQFVTVKRPSGIILVLCEVQVFAIPDATTTFSTTTSTTAFEPSTTTTVTSTLPTTTTTTTTAAATTTTTTLPITQSTTSATTTTTSEVTSTDFPFTVDTNIAFNKPATQFSTLEYLFSWTADKAVDNCTDRDDPDNQQCCSATEGGIDNFWTVDLQQQYLVYRIVVIGRTPESSNQLEGFEVYTRQESFFPELQVYDNTGQPYDDGIFVIDIQTPSLVQFVTVKRPSGIILVLCEVQVFAIPDATTTFSTTTSTTAFEPSTTTTVTSTLPPTTATTTATAAATTTTISTTTLPTTQSTISAITTTTSEVTETSTESPFTVDTNIAFNKTATQFSTLEYLFSWTADKAVDNCTDRDDPDNQQCCSATEGGIDNFWTVDLQQQYLVYRIVIIGRTPDFLNQLENFILYTRQDDTSPEFQVYDNSGQVYGDGIFTLDVPVPSPVRYVTVKRPTGSIIVLCEVQVYAIPETQSTTTEPVTESTTTEPATQTSSITTSAVITTTTSCPTNTFGEACTPCGNCLTFIPCNSETGVCSVGCTEGWQPPLCNTACNPGFYGVSCLQTCGNCEFGAPCDIITGACPGACDPGWEGINCNSVITTVTSMETTTTANMETTTSSVEPTTTEPSETNIALNKPATQFNTLDYFFLWTADKAVDGCLLRNDSDNQECCSATQGDIFENFWSVDLQQQYLVSRIVVYGRTPDFSSQLEGFTLYTSETGTSSEDILYNNGIEPYEDGIFDIIVDPPRLVQTITIRRPTGTIITLCEVEVYGVFSVPPTSTTTEVTSTTDISTTTSTEATTVTTTTEVFCPPNTYGDNCTACGNCVTFVPCNSVTGECAIGCAAGWRPPLCNTPCEPGSYGISCERTCGNCEFGVPCDIITGACPGACDSGWEGINCDSAITTVTTTEPTTTTTNVQETTTTVELTDVNVGVGKPATQFSTVDFGFLWTADKAVDNCTDRDDPDNQQCCSATEGGIDNFWTVDLQQQYLVSRIVVTGRLEAFSGQLEGFELYTRETASGPETLLYDNTNDPYNDGIFTLDLDPPQIIQTITVRRPSGIIIVLCEVQVFGVLNEATTSTSTTTATPTVSTETSTPTTTTTTTSVPTSMPTSTTASTVASSEATTTATTEPTTISLSTDPTTATPSSVTSSSEPTTTTTIKATITTTNTVEPTTSEIQGSEVTETTSQVISDTTTVASTSSVITSTDSTTVSDSSSTLVASTDGSTEESTASSTLVSILESTTSSTAVSSQETTSETPDGVSSQGPTSSSSQIPTSETSDEILSEATTVDSSEVTSQQTTQDTVQATSEGITGTDSTVSVTNSTLMSTLMSSPSPTRDDADGQTTESTHDGGQVTTTALDFPDYDDGSSFTRPTLAVLVTSLLLTLVYGWVM